MGCWVQCPGADWHPRLLVQSCCFKPSLHHTTELIISLLTTEQEQQVCGRKGRRGEKTKAGKRSESEQGEREEEGKE